MKIVCVPLCAASLAVYVMFLGFDNMDQVHASGPLGDNCVSVNFAMAENDCKYRNRSLFTLSDLKTSRGGRFVRNVTTILTEIWIRGDENGSCQTYLRLPTKGSANKTDEDLKFQRANCDDQHHYVCIQHAHLEPQYHPACYEKTSEVTFGNLHLFPTIH
ncbi:uncharacterized protein LOC124257071 isoform X2 [Haliotis rubra]|uniref:uncharacterized protein LOC124257071 isoform X2 n=1 Tax=Haliotis rubra TaxID=36100 RepID=UPI001EE620F7|nr:uncharacterized protein LOC124257071 isoform X2 [Haliotis rubra]